MLSVVAIVYAKTDRLRLGAWLSRFVAAVVVLYAFVSYDFDFYGLTYDFRTGTNRWITIGIPVVLALFVLVIAWVAWSNKEEELWSLFEGSQWLLIAVALIFLSHWLFQPPHDASKTTKANGPSLTEPKRARG